MPCTSFSSWVSRSFSRCLLLSISGTKDERQALTAGLSVSNCQTGHSTGYLPIYAYPLGVCVSCCTFSLAFPRCRAAVHVLLAHANLELEFPVFHLSSQFLSVDCAHK